MSNKLPDNIKLEQLQENWDLAVRAYQKAFKRIRLLDATDRGRLWEAIKSKFPPYQILPDTNHVAYVKSNLLASLYTVGKSARLQPTTEEDMNIIEEINMVLDHQWDLCRTGYYQMQAGARAALCNLGITQVGWDTELSGSSAGEAYEGMPAYKNIDPLKFMRDPYSESLETAGYCMTWDMLHKAVLKSNPLYKDTLDKAIQALDTTNTQNPTEAHRDGPKDSEARNRKDYFRLITHWVRDGDQFHEIHTLDNKEILHAKEDIKPSAFPFAMLYCNLPEGDLVGTSEPAKIFANSVAYNLMNSVILTAEYKNQRPPKFINSNSGLNINSFVKHGNEADYTFVVNGDASKAVHYHQFPQTSPNLGQILGNLGNDIQQVTGVDGRYTGKDTGSILTTGGIESMLDQATLVDTPKINNYEEYTRQLTRLTLENLHEFGGKRKYFISKPDSPDPKNIEVNFPKVDTDTLRHYNISISSELPKNKARIAQMANTLMEKQLQYQQAGQQVDLITPEEWLMMQDLPYRELMQKRMGLQKNANYVEKVSQILFTFAGLAKNGMDPREAIAMTAQEMQKAENPNAPGPEDMMMPDENMPVPDLPPDMY